MTSPDLVNHPPHYVTHPSGIEVISYTRHMTFDCGNAVKYVMRRDLKGTPVQDLDKAIWYLTDSLKHGLTYTPTHRVQDIIAEVIQSEPNDLVALFLKAMFWTAPDLELARNICIELRKSYES